MPNLSAPAVLTAGTLASTATTTFDGSTVTVHARSELSGLDLAGLVKIESVVTDLTATTDGATTTLSGGTVVTGAELLGQAITIDAEAIHVDEKAGGGASPPAAALDDAVEALGIDITVAAPMEQASDTAGQLASAGRRIDLELSDRTFPALDDVLGPVDLLPPRSSERGGGKEWV